MSDDALGTVQSPNVSAAARRGLFGATEELPALPNADNWQELVEQVADLGRLIVNSTDPDPPTGIAAGNTNTDGNAYIPIYQVSQGEQFRLHRAVVECQSYTPAAPYTNSSGWMGFYSLDSRDAPASFTGIGDLFQGALKDLAPSTVGGPLFPAVFTDNSMQASEVRGPKFLILVVVGGPASKRVTVNYQGSLRRARGIA
jgi:hypothetical protein